MKTEPPMNTDKHGYFCEEVKMIANSTFSMHKESGYVMQQSHNKMEYSNAWTSESICGLKREPNE